MTMFLSSNMPLCTSQWPPQLGYIVYGCVEYAHAMEYTRGDETRYLWHDHDWCKFSNVIASPKVD